MSQLRALLHRIFGVFAPPAADAELREEMEAHLEMQTHENIRRGMTPESARREALLASGGLTNAVEHVRERRGLPWIETLVADVRFGTRSLRRNPAFTVVAVATLALGIGANTAIFSVVNAVVIKPLPYHNSDQLVAVASVRDGRHMAVSPRDFLDWREQTHDFSALAASFTGTTILTGNGDPERLTQAGVSANTFDVLAIRALVGRSFVAGEDEASAPRVAMLGERVWRRHFGGDKSVIGRTMTFDGYPTTIIGIAPAAMQWPTPSDVWMTTRFSQNDVAPGSRGTRWLDVVARVAPTATVTSARAEMNEMARRLQQLDSTHNSGVGSSVTPLLTSVVGELQRPLFVLLGAVAFVLLIACANVASLTLGRIAARDAELAVRTALGAGRGRIARQILTESLLVALVGGVLGVLLAVAGIKGLVAMAPAGLPRVGDVSLDGQVLLFTFAVTLAAGVVFGVVPALFGSAANIHQRLRAAGRSAVGGKANARSRRVLVAGEMALCIVLLSGAGLLLRSFALLRAVDPGFNATNVSTFDISLPSNGRYAKPEQRQQFTATLLDRIRRVSGVSAAAVSFGLPLSGENVGFSFEVVDRPPASANDEPRAQARVASAQYFAAMGIPLLQGRLFDDRDREGSRQVLVISREVARRYFANENPIGKYIRTGWGMNGKKYGGEVIGIVGDVRQMALDQQNSAHLYMSCDQWPLDEFDVVVRASSPPAVVFGAAKAVLKDLDAEIPMNGARSLSDIVDQSLGARRFYLTLLSAFAAVAMVLALVGIYGVVAYSVQQRRRELGVRLALGASKRSIVALLLNEGMRLAFTGVAIGLVGTFALSRLLDSLLFNVGTHDPLTLALAPVLLTGAAALACLIPARNAARANPIDAIRSD